MGSLIMEERLNVHARTLPGLGHILERQVLQQILLILRMTREVRYLRTNAGIVCEDKGCRTSKLPAQLLKMKKGMKMVSYTR